jgi:hypothetical protein
MSFASDQSLKLTGVRAGADLSAKQYYCVKMASTAQEVVLNILATTRGVGILQNDPADGEEALVAVVGVVKAASEASVTVNDYVAASTTGRVKTTTTDTNELVGIALESNSAAGDIITVLLTPGMHAG